MDLTHTPLSISFLYLLRLGAVSWLVIEVSLLGLKLWRNARQRSKVRSNQAAFCDFMREWAERERAQ